MVILRRTRKTRMREHGENLDSKVHRNGRTVNKNLFYAILHAVLCSGTIDQKRHPRLASPD